LSRQTLKFYHLFDSLGVNFFQGETVYQKLVGKHCSQPVRLLRRKQAQSIVRESSKLLFHYTYKS
jgi:hypothetical protein